MFFKLKIETRSEKQQVINLEDLVCLLGLKIGKRGYIVVNITPITT